jgi:hypothetical protein
MSGSEGSISRVGVLDGMFLTDLCLRWDSITSHLLTNTIAILTPECFTGTMSSRLSSSKCGEWDCHHFRHRNLQKLPAVPVKETSLVEAEQQSPSDRHHCDSYSLVLCSSQAHCHHGSAVQGVEWNCHNFGQKNTEKLPVVPVKTMPLAKSQ